MLCPICDAHLDCSQDELLYCPECDNYACARHWVETDGKCPICGQHQKILDAVKQYADEMEEKRTSNS